MSELFVRNSRKILQRFIIFYCLGVEKMQNLKWLEVEQQTASHNLLPVLIRIPSSPLH